MFQLIDPQGGGPNAASGKSGTLVFSPPADGGVITPSDAVVYTPPIMVWVGDVGPVNVTIVPYGRAGDETVTFSLKAGMSVPVLCRQVLATGTTALSLFLGSGLPNVVAASGGSPGTTITADSTLVTADTTSFTADNG